MLHTFSFWLYLFFTFNIGPKSIASTLGNQTNNLALLKFKSSISNDPYEILISWNSSTHFCKWYGITCNPIHQRVTELKLSGQLHGSISPYVGNLSFLKVLNLADNNLFGKIPPELGRLLQMQQLLLTNNSLTAEIPANLTSCSNLQDLDFTGNNLTGKIPKGIGSFWKLQTLMIAKNNITGGIPPVIGNLSSLTMLRMAYNNLEGEIPQEICRLKNLTMLYVPANKLSGTIPSCVYNMSSLTMISVAVNEFNGSLPSNMFHNLPNLQILYIGGNQISGPVPTSVANASTLAILDTSENHFVRQVPSLGKLQHLHWLNLYSNDLGENSSKDLEFLKSLTNCTKLKMLAISENNFGGHLPNSLGNLSSQISQLYLGTNHISGKIPIELGNLTSLILLTMEDSHLEGTIPATFGKFQKMQKLELGGNKLSGDIPASIGNLSQLYHLGIGDNMLKGNIPKTIGNCQNLQYLNLSQNNLRGAIPSQLFGLSSLTSLDLSKNSLSGSLPDEVGQLQNIGQIDVSENRLLGEISRTIGDCTSLEFLYLQGNLFHGIIPSSLASLKGLRYLDLSRNNLSGSIPKDLQNISFLEYFNVSFNKLDGEVPTEGVFQNASGLAVTENNNLCGGIPQLHLPPCPVKGMKPAKHHNFKLMAVIVSVVCFLLILVFILSIYWVRERNRKRYSDSPITDQPANVSYRNLYNGTDGFSSRNLIGSGSYGFVYKGTLVSEGGVVAIKVLNLQKKGAHKSFVVECNALKNIRHRNLVKVLTCCSTTDYKGQEFKALIFEYMKNGSLDSWLHPTAETTNQSKSLNLEQGLNIIVDVASAVHYLHYECEKPTIHCDLKPSNVLLDDSMVAHVSDFGLARLLPTVGVSLMQSSTTGIKGTVGYAPPEYGMGSTVSSQGDMYSFGILVLEMLTGRRPTDEIFEDGNNLYNYVKISISGHLLQTVDPTILLCGLERSTDIGNHMEKCLLSLFKIALACSVESANERMTMVEVTRELEQIKSFFH